MKIHAEIFVSLKPTVRDPQGLTISSGLKRLGFSDIQDVRAGKYFEVTFDAESEEEAKNSLDEMCSKLLSNPVIEDYRFQISEI